MEPLDWVEKLLQLYINAPSSAFTCLKSSVELSSFMQDFNASPILFGFDGSVSFHLIFLKNLFIENNIKQLKTQIQYLILSKRSAVVTCENVASTLQLTPLARTPLNTLYQTIHGIYSPILLKYTLIKYLDQKTRLLAITKLNVS